MSADEENIKPAIRKQEKPSNLPNEMSDEEFRTTLYSWFEDRGMIADLRAHLRRQMINYLKDTSLGQTVHKMQNTLSPKTQVVNLLIAEFFLKNKYHYSLSVFSSEVPFISIFPDITTSIINFSTNTQKDKNIPNFSEQNFWDIIQALGFSLKAPECQQLHDAYFNNPENSLLNSMIQLLSNLCNDPNDINDLALLCDEDIQADLNNCESWVKDIHNLLVHYNVKSSKIKNLRNHLKNIVEHQQSKVKLEECTKYNVMKVRLENEIKNTESNIYHTLSEMERSFLQDKEKMTEAILEYEKEIQKLRTQIDFEQTTTENMKKLLEMKNEKLNIRESEIEEQSQILELRVKAIEEFHESVIRRNTTTTKQQSIQVNLAEIKNESFEINDTIKNSSYNSNRSEKNTNELHKQSLPDPQQVEQKLLGGIIDNLERQNIELRSLNQVQQKRLEELTARNTQLMNDLQNTQTTINILTQSRQSNTITVPPLLAPPNPPPMPLRHSNNSLNGGGENLGFSMHPTTPPPSQRLVYNQPTRDQRRKVPKRLLVHSSTEDSTSSPTEEILTEARRRLRRLEEETDEVDRNYIAFKERQSRAIQRNLLYFDQERLENATFNIPTFEATRVTFNNTNVPSTSTSNQRCTAVFNNVPSTSTSNIIFGQTFTKTENLKKEKSKKHNIDKDRSAKNSQKPKTAVGGRAQNKLEETRFSTEHSTNSSGLFDVLPPVRSLSISSIEISSDSDLSEK